MISGLMALCVVAMWAFPETPMARWLNTVLVEQPLAWLSKLTRRDVIFLFVAITLLLVAGDFIVIFGVSDLFAIGVGLSFYFDAVLVVTAVTIATAAATVWRDARARLSTWWGAAVQRRARAARRNAMRKTRQPKSLDDEDAPGWESAYAV